MNKDQAKVEQEPELSQEEKDLDDVSNQTDFMEFSVTELAEQLTKQDAVSVNSHVFFFSFLILFFFNS